MFSRPQEPESVPETTQAQADRGNADAQFRLGLKYANDGGTQDYAQAAQWYLKAAEQSHSLAQFNLGVMYARGQGVPQDDAQSVTWIRKAAHQGDAGAQFALGVKHLRQSYRETSKDTIESKIEAYKWLHLSTAQGYKGSQNAWDSLTCGMTREAVVEGNHRVATFLAGQSPELKGKSAGLGNGQGTDS